MGPHRAIFLKNSMIWKSCTINGKRKKSYIISINIKIRVQQYEFGTMSIPSNRRFPFNIYY